MSDPESKLIVYSTPDGRTEIQLRAEGGTVWLTQLEIAELFATTKQNVSLHVQNIPERWRVTPSLSSQGILDKLPPTGKAYVTKLFNLEMILAIGYRVKSLRGTQFRQWPLQPARVSGEALRPERRTA